MRFVILCLAVRELVCASLFGFALCLLFLYYDILVCLMRVGVGVEFVSCVFGHLCVPSVWVSCVQFGVCVCSYMLACFACFTWLLACFAPVTAAAVVRFILLPRGERAAG